MWEYFSDNMAPIIKNIQCHYDESNDGTEVYDMMTMDLFGEAVLKCIEKTPKMQVHISSYIIFHCLHGAKCCFALLIIIF